MPGDRQPVNKPALRHRPRGPTALQVVSVNVNGLPVKNNATQKPIMRYKQSKFLRLCETTKADVLCIQETHAETNGLTSTTLPPRYSLAASSNTENSSRRGGVAIALREGLCGEIITLPALNSVSACAITITLTRSTHLHVVCVYVPPTTRTAYEELSAIASKIPEGDPILWAGDFNPTGWDFAGFCEDTEAFHAHDINVPTYISGGRRSTPDRLLCSPGKSWDPLASQDDISDNDDAETVYEKTFPARPLDDPLVSDHLALHWEIPRPGPEDETERDGDSWRVKLEALDEHEWLEVDAMVAAALPSPCQPTTDAEAENLYNATLRVVQGVTLARSKRVRSGRHPTTRNTWGAKAILRDPKTVQAFLEAGPSTQPDYCAETTPTPARPEARRRPAEKAQGKNRLLNTPLTMEQFAITEDALTKQWRHKVKTTRSANELWSFVAKAEARMGGMPRGKKTPAVPTTPLTFNGRTAKTARQRAHLLAEYFATRFEPNGPAPPCPTLGDRDQAQKHNPDPIQPQDIAEALNNMRDAAPGRDGVTRMIWSRLCSTHANLSAVFTYSLRTGYVPQSLRLGEICPIPKPNKCGIGAFRPICLLQTAAKILERIVHDRVVATIAHRLSTEQYAFREGLCAENMLAELTRRAAESKSEKKIVLISSLDLASAYDSVRFHLLEKKVRALGAPHWACRWISCWLRHRRVRVRILSPFGKVASRDFHTTCGLPQGGVLSPLLWIAFTHDIRSALADIDWGLCEVDVLTSADDVTLIMTGPNPQDVAAAHEKAVSALREYFGRNQLDLSAPKSNCMWMAPQGQGAPLVLRGVPPSETIIHAGRKSWPTLHHRSLGWQPPITPAYPDTCFPRTQCARVLGVLVDDNLSFAHHIATLKTRCARRISVLRRISATTWGADFATLRAIYKAIVEGPLCYGLTAWGPFAAEETWHRLNIDVVHPGARAVTGLPRWTRIEALYRVAGLSSIQNLYAERCATRLDALERTSLNEAASNARLRTRPQGEAENDQDRASRPPSRLCELVAPPLLKWGLACDAVLNLVTPRTSHADGQTTSATGPPETIYTPNAHLLKRNHAPFTGRMCWVDHGDLVRRRAGFLPTQYGDAVEPGDRPPRPAKLTLASARADAAALNTLFDKQLAAGKTHFAAATDGAIQNVHGVSVATCGHIIFTDGNAIAGEVEVLGRGRCAYDAEVAALTRAVDRVARMNEVSSLLILTDCQSAVKAMEKWRRASPDITALQAAIAGLGAAHTDAEIHVQFCPGHSGVAASEAVDALINHLGPKVAGCNPNTLPLLTASRRVVKDGIRNLLEREEDQTLASLAARCSSDSAKNIAQLGASRRKIRGWLDVLRGNRLAQVVLTGLITNTVCKWRGTTLVCQDCHVPLSLKHVVEDCPPLKDDREDAAYATSTTPPLTIEKLKDHPNRLPILVLAALPSLRRILTSAARRERDAAACRNAPDSTQQHEAVSPTAAQA